MRLLSEKDMQEVKYLTDVEEAYPCSVYDNDNIKYVIYVYNPLLTACRVVNL